MVTVDAYLGLGSRYSYLAATQFERIERESGCRFERIPISSVELMQLRGRSPFDGPPLSGQYELDYRRRDALMWAELYRVPFVEPRGMPREHRLMARACRAAERQMPLGGYVTRLFRAIFAECRAIDRDMLASLTPDPARLLEDLGDAELDRRVSLDAQSAHRRGAFGVPTFFVGEAIFWGNDRLPLLQDHLRRVG